VTGDIDDTNTSTSLAVSECTERSKKGILHHPVSCINVSSILYQWRIIYFHQFLTKQGNKAFFKISFTELYYFYNLHAL